MLLVLYVAGVLTVWEEVQSVSQVFIFDLELAVILQKLVVRLCEVKLLFSQLHVWQKDVFNHRDRVYKPFVRTLSATLRVSRPTHAPTIFERSVHLRTCLLKERVHISVHLMRLLHQFFLLETQLILYFALFGWKFGLSRFALNLKRSVLGWWLIINLNLFSIEVIVHYLSWLWVLLGLKDLLKVCYLFKVFVASFALLGIH